jgi:hypothetical protein
MADIRIKDLTTLESASLTGDVFVIDGTTGTRKLSAFSPSFGGNATVTGTLTVNSSSPSVFAGQVRSNLSNASLSDPQIFVRNPAASLTNGAVSQAAFFGQPGYTTFVGTTGDGTTGSYQGGVLGSAIRFNEGYVITDAANGLLLHSINGSIRLATGNPGSVKATFDSAGTLSLTATTASTSTSSGALVVSGGVGVAKRIYSGEGLDTAGDNATHISFVRNGTISIGPTSAATPKLQVGGGLLLANTSQSVPAWGDVGAQLSVAGAVLTDTSSSGTVSRVVVNSIASSALAASSTTTYTQAATLFISNAPTANTNVTITNAYALYTAGGRINFQGLPTSSAGLQAGTLWNDGGTLKVA